MDSLQPTQSPGSGADEQNGGQKPPIVRSARACTVCRNAKMRCIGAEDGAQKCQRCKRQNLECIFEKHRRGRKPGSKLSEHSKMLRRLERENKAKTKEASTTASLAPPPPQPPRAPPQPPPIQTAYNHQEFVPSEHPHSASLNSGSSGMGSTPTQPYDMPYQASVTYPSSDTRQTEIDSLGESTPDADDAIYPARVVDKETKRHSFFHTILNPTSVAEGAADRQKAETERGQAAAAAPRYIMDPDVRDPIAAGLLDEQEAKVLFDLVFMRLNGFINLFDPRLHTVPYVRSRSPFLFSCLIMAGCKFWKAELYRKCQQIAHSFAYKAFAEGWQSLEVVQAFACLTYWKEPDDTRTWTYIGYACRMAVELGINNYVGRPEGETEEERRERRNRERTYLVLWVHDRALSMQTGRNWMLPEDDLVRHIKTWHEDNNMRPEDVIVAAMVNLRQIAAETTDVYRMQKGGLEGHYSDVNHEILLRGCNSKLTAWMDLWDAELRRASGQAFHYAFLSFFRLHVRLFLNSLGLQGSSTPLSRNSPSLQALSICYTSAVQSLEIITKQFAPWGLLRYGQDSMTVMSAYSGVFLIKLLRRTAVLSELHDSASHEIHNLISQTATAYQEAALLAVSSSSAAYHARFLRALVAKDAESKMARVHRQSVSSRNSSDGMNEDARPVGGGVPSYSPVAPAQTETVPNSHSASPQYPQYQSVPHPTMASTSIHATPQMSPTETKPTIGTMPYRTAPAPAGSSGNPYPQYSSEYPHPHGHSHPPMVVPYPQVMQGAPVTPITQSIPSELDSRYSRSLLQELGYPAMGVEPVGEWFAQAMGPSGCVGLL